VIEMKLVHDVHRAAVSLLADSAARPRSAPWPELAELRDFVVAALRHHHESEDELLWPLCEATDPGLAEALRELTAEHHHLDSALAALEAAAVGEAGHESLAASARSVAELVGRHLEHEETATFPALRRLTGSQWAQFSRAAMESAPAAGAHLQIGLMDEVGEPADVALVLAGLPAPVADALPAIREQARLTLGVLFAAQRAAS
jgi:hemerythrin-like domain-containing protein